MIGEEELKEADGKKITGKSQKEDREKALEILFFCGERDGFCRHLRPLGLRGFRWRVVRGRIETILGGKEFGGIGLNGCKAIGTLCGVIRDSSITIRAHFLAINWLHNFIVQLWMFFWYTL